MQTESHAVLWLDGSQRVSLHDLVAISGMTEAELRDLVDIGALAPFDPRETPWTFSADCVITVRTASRLREELELEPHALALALSLLDTIRRLEAEVSRLRARQSSSFTT